MAYHKTAVVDFDNTIAGYDKWRGPDVFGPPIPFARDAINELLEWGWRVVLFTTRNNTDRIRQWLVVHKFHDLPINSTSHNPPDTSHKPIAEVYFDDRDAHVVGTMPYNWHRAMARVRTKYQPRPLTVEIDDASAWSAWYVRMFVAPIERARFRTNLENYLVIEEIEHNTNIDQQTKNEMVSAILRGVEYP